MRLNPKNMGISAGIIWGSCLFLVTIICVLTGGSIDGYGAKFLKIIVDIYPGYNISIVGSIIGLVYGFIDGFIALVIFGMLYNWLGKRNRY